MLLLKKVKVWLGIAALAVIGVLTAMLKIRTAEKETAEASLGVAVSANKSNEKVIKSNEVIQEIKDEIATTSDDDVFAELRQYDRNRDSDDLRG